MWVITKAGFVSAVQHNDNPDVMRVRARRAEHLAFGLEVIDFGSDASDYRYHCDVPRSEFAVWLLDRLSEVDYESHAKEAMAGDDSAFYGSLLGCWRELYRIQPRYDKVT